MAEYREFEGKNVAKAIEKACETLTVTKKELTYDILSYGSTGIFGLSGSRQARIRVVVPDTPETIAERETETKTIVEEESRENDAPPAVEESEASEMQDADIAESEEEEEDDDEADDTEALESGKEALQKIVDALTDEAVVTFRRSKKQVVYHVEGGNPAVLIGKRGQTLEAIKGITEKIVNKKSLHRRYVQVDIGDYLEKRKQNLERMAQSAAEKVERTGKPSSLGQMNARDRRIVHLALKTNKAVKTQSIGEGHIRKLMVFPKKRNNGRK